jgi:hypothetical protein
MLFYGPACICHIPVYAAGPRSLAETGRCGPAAADACSAASSGATGHIHVFNGSPRWVRCCLTCSNACLCWRLLAAPVLRLSWLSGSLLLATAASSDSMSDPGAAAACCSRCCRRSTCCPSCWQRERSCTCCCCSCRCYSCSTSLGCWSSSACCWPGDDTCMSNAVNSQPTQANVHISIHRIACGETWCYLWYGCYCCCCCPMNLGAVQAVTACPGDVAGHCLLLHRLRGP